MRFVISSGHGKFVRGAKGLIDEVDEARRVVSKVAALLEENGHQVVTFHDNTSTTQNQNLQTIVNFHNSQTRDMDISVHFNAYVPTEGARGTEVLYVTQDKAAQKVVNAIALAGHLVNRGIKKRTDLYFLNKTNKPALLFEICFVDAADDVKNYQQHFDTICQAIANVPDATKPSPPPDIPQPLAKFAGNCSWFGGPADKGVAPDEGLAFIFNYNDAPHLFLKEQPPGTTGLARRLNPEVHYIACRWDYEATPKAMLIDKNKRAEVRAGNKKFLAWPADWGPNASTNRVADLSPALMAALDITTDDVVKVVYPAAEE